jgi:hypothetical protein
VSGESSHDIDIDYILVVGHFGLAIDIDIVYMLAVGHFGLATGSGGKTQSNMHNESCTKPFTPR